MEMINDAPLEPEVKFSDVDLEEIRGRLTELGARLETPERDMRRVVFGREANRGLDCSYVRVRDEGGGKITMSAKYNAVGDDINQREIVARVDSFENGVALLRAFGLVPTNYQESRRTTYCLGTSTLVEFEEWPGLRKYIEIEGKDEAAVRCAAEQLGLDWARRTTVPTSELYRQQYPSLSEEALQQKLADLRFDS